MSQHVIEAIDPLNDAFLTEIYHASFFRQEERPAFRADGTQARWALDLRLPLLDSSYLHGACVLLRDQLKGLGIRQVVGGGVAGTLLVGGLVAVGENFTGAIVREQRKPHGFREIIEGRLSDASPIAVIDDILSSGRTILRMADTLAAKQLTLAATMAIFHFAWRDGESRLRERGIEVHSLAKIRPVRPDTRVAVVWERHSQAGVAWQDDGQRNAPE